MPNWSEMDRFIVSPKDKMIVQIDKNLNEAGAI